MLKNSKALCAKLLLCGALLLPMGSGALAAMPTDASTQPEINVTGTASRAIAPSYALLTLGVTSQGDSASLAKSHNDRIMSDLLSKLASLDISKNHIQTSNLSVNPEYTNAPQGNRITSYTVNNQVRIRINDLGKVSKVIDAAVASGANNILNLSFEAEKSKNLNDQLTTEAIQDGKHRAEVIAAALGRTLGDVKAVSIQSEPTYYEASNQRMYRVAALSTSTPVEEGEIHVNQSAQLTFYLK